MDPSIIVAIVALAATVISGAITFKKDHAQIEGSTYAVNTNAAIAGLQAAFDTQKELTEQCKGECAELRRLYGEEQRARIEADAKLANALSKIDRLERTISGTS